MLTLAQHARARTLRNPQVGQIVYYFRRGKGKQENGYKGPARVIAVEPASHEGQASSVIWLAHGATLVRAAPEHLRVATPLETNVYDVVEGTAAPPQPDAKKFNNRYIDLGRVPDAREQEETVGELNPDLPRPDYGPAPAGPFAQPPSPMVYTPPSPTSEASGGGFPSHLRPFPSPTVSTGEPDPGPSDETSRRRSVTEIPTEGQTSIPRRASTLPRVPEDDDSELDSEDLSLIHI